MLGIERVKNYSFVLLIIFFSYNSVEKSNASKREKVEEVKMSNLLREIYVCGLIGVWFH